MDVTVVAVAIFIVFSIFVPASMLLTSMLLRRNTQSNSVRDASYESAETSKGNRISIMTEYLHYFGMFISFEIVVAIILIWAPVANQIALTPTIELFGLMGAGFILEALVLLTARSRDD
ncbi:MAG: NADH-quinone oxidoreductase subunit A [Candidatus Micrarchaeota archaeon]|nr:NADH-quinone oxidoreductase subunit A [Candidatus Micrarchaeota archaeon]MDE1833873.1 NADH-quinone oxidoreductase subunit A [Candidatus Micrarchaeota archaeon]MDE1859360.1 NADH-quinone oxidoreductase subunit A [Candidatus Micrarchaeota archaeon]